MTNPSFLSPLFQIAGSTLQYKPYAEYPTWITVWDISAFVPPTLVYPDCAYLPPAVFRTITTGFATPAIQDNQWTEAYSDLSGSGAKSECKILLAAGDYDVTVGYAKTSSSGRLAVKVNGTAFPVSRIDMYNATTQLAQIYEGALATGLSAGVHTIAVEVDGKNISSSAFHCLVSFLAIRKKP